MTDAELAAILLLRDTTRRVVRVDLDYQYESGGVPATGTLYFSNDADYRDANPYVDAIDAIPEYTRSLGGPLLSSHTSSLGTLELPNHDGRLDYILGLAIDGSEVRFTLCALDTPAATLLMFKCVAVKATAPSFDRVSIQLKDAGMLLDQSIGGTVKVGGTGPDADQWRTKNFGLVHQVPCKVVDPFNLIYTHSDTGYGLATSSGSYVLTIRARGLPIAFTNLGDGMVQLLANPVGATVTADLLYVVPGPGNEYRCVSDAMSTLIAPYVSNYVGPGPTYSVRPAAAVGTWLAAGGEDYQIGKSFPERENALEVLGELCESGLCFWGVTRLNGFTFGRLRPSYIAGLGLAAAHTITEGDIRDDDFQIDELPAEYYQLQATMSRNWQVVTDLATSLSANEQAKFSRTGLYVLQKPGVGTDYANAPQLYNKTLVQSKTIDTLLSGADDTTDPALLQLWMETRRSMTLPKLKVISTTVGIEFYDVEEGDPITVRLAGDPVKGIPPRYGYAAGVDFQVISVSLKLPDKVSLKLLRRDVQASYAGRATAAPEGPPYSAAGKLVGFSISVIAGIAFAAAGAIAVPQVVTMAISVIPGVATSGTTGGGGDGGTPFPQAAYVTIGNDANLTNERALTAGSGVTITDNGPNGTVVIAASGASSPLTTKGDLYGHSTVDARVPVGSNDQVLVADSTQTLGLKWASLGSGFGIQTLNVRAHWAQAAAGGASLQLFGINGVQNVGNVTAVSLTNTNYFTQQTRVSAACGAGRTSNGGVRTQDRILWRGNASGLGGFTAALTFGMSARITSAQIANGLFALGNTGVGFGAFGIPEPSTFIDCFFMGIDSGDANWQLMHNDASGNCTKIDTGFSAAGTSTDWYRLTLTAAPNASTIDYLVEQLNTGSSFSGTANSNLPTASVFLGWHAETCNGVNVAGGVITIDVGYYYAQSNY